MTKERLLKVLDNVLAWGNDHDKDFRECLLCALDLTDDEIKNDEDIKWLDLSHYVDYGTDDGDGDDESEVGDKKDE